MREKYLSIISYVFIIIGFLSCEEDLKNIEINPEEFYGDGSYFVSLAKLKPPELNAQYCADPQIFELRPKRNLKEFGTVSVYGDGQFLNFQVNLIQDRINEGWGLEETLIWIGRPEDWIEGKDGPEGGWRKVIGIDIERYQFYPSKGIHQFKLQDWMYEDCFTIAVRATVYDPERNGEAIDGFINNGDFLTHMFNKPNCLEECIDPGTQNVNYWENNPEAWSNGVTAGGIFYSEEIAIQIMKGITTNDDMSNVLFEELVSAKLNVDLGNTSYCIIEAIEAADAWMEENGPVGSGILSDNPAWTTGNSLANELESYNNGLMCADPAN